jgi:hypothetical protein
MNNYIDIEYDGAYPNLCRGQLVVTIGKTKWTFPPYCLSSGGCAWTKPDYTGTTHGSWTIREWPEGFPAELKEAVTEAVNGLIEHGCCGGCI